MECHCFENFLADVVMSQGIQQNNFYLDGTEECHLLGDAKVSSEQIVHNPVCPECILNST